MRTATFAVAAVLVIGIGSVAVAGVDLDRDRDGADNARAGILGEVLTDLVSDGTITEDQSDAIWEALEEKKEEIAEQREEARELLKSLWEDGVLTRAEIEQLPQADRILGMEGVSEALEDGQLTTEEIKELGPRKSWGDKLRAAHRHRSGGRG